MTERRRHLSALAIALALTIAACGFCAVASAAPDPLSDADGDGLPYKWETPEPTPPSQGGSGGGTNGAGTSPAQGKCGSKQQLRKGRCVPKCKKGKKLKGRRCVKKGKDGKKRGRKAGTRATAATVSVAPLGANPDHKDIFVQIDYAGAGLKQNVASACSELDALVTAFANAPVSNPDGQTGINLHIDAGVACPSRSYDFGGSKVFSAGACPGVGATFQKAQVEDGRVGTFHSAGFSPLCGISGNENGAADQPGAKMVVFTEGLSFAHELMHELGHNLGLDHPGPPSSFLTNRISVMNSRLEVSDNGFSFVGALDYQRFSIPALDENNLSETAGISAPAPAHRFQILHFCAGEGSFRQAWPADGPIDWNCNSPVFGPPTIDPGTVSADVNGDGLKTVLPATGNEWATLDYASGGRIGP